MQRLQGYPFERLPTGEQARKMGQCASACRFVSNRALALQKDNHTAGGRFIGYVATAKQLTQWRHGAETPWRGAAPVHPAQHALKDPSIEGPRAKSDGSQVAALHSFKKHEKASRKYQRRMSGKTKFSRNWKKARARVQKSHTGIANAPAKIFSTKLRRRSTKTTRSYASKTCRCST